ncbi:MAG: (2Fe-2S) ferredoxin domain-containing protein [Leptolyngbyaceae cyanobacterium SL_7_1]|nr:(2Fe-2S) ferredoxin domain-containing protein [Leptolyngbyaceae cyanobacterium SL_7_1]
MPVTSPSTPRSAPQRRCIFVCQHRSCSRSGAAEVLAAFQAAQVPGVLASASDCMGQCSSGPTVQVMPDNTWYCRVKPSDVPMIVEQHLLGNTPVQTLLHSRFHAQMDISSYSNLS